MHVITIETCKHHLQMSSPVTAIAASADFSYIAVGFGDGQLHICGGTDIILIIVHIVQNSYSIVFRATTNFLVSTCKYNNPQL